MRRGVASTLVLLLVVSSVASVVGTVSAAQTDVTIQSVNSSVDQPAPGEKFTLTVDVANLQSSSGTVEVTDVYVRKNGEEYGRVKDVGKISADGTLSVPVSVKIDDAGEKTLTVYAVVEDADGDTQRVSYPVRVDVENPDEAVVSFSNLDAVAGQESPINVTVSNGDSGTLSNVRLELGGDAEVENPERVSASLESGSQATHTYQVTFPDAGEHALNATLKYRTSEGSTRTVSREVTVDVDEADVDTGLTAKTKEVNGSSSIAATLTEYGNVELRDVMVGTVVDGDVVTRSLVDDVPAEGSQSVLLDGSDVPSGAVTIVAEYTAAGQQHSTRTTLQYSPQETSNVSLTGVELSQSGTTFTLSGDAANLGSADAKSVLVSVVEADGVTPVAPNKEYFIGSIDASEFSTFELTARVSGNVDSVPVRITYSVDGERVSEVADVAIGSTNVSAAASSGGNAQNGASGGANGPPGANGPGGQGSSGLPLTAIGGVVVVLLVAGGGFAVYRWRKHE